jgi:hypothetical protein
MIPRRIKDAIETTTISHMGQSFVKMVKIRQNLMIMSKSVSYKFKD